MDTLISRILKNWVGHHEPPADGKERLLEAAKGPSEPERRFVGWIWLNQLISQPVPQTFIQDDALTVPFTQSRILSLHFTTSIRFVA